MRASTAPANNGSEGNVTVGSEGYLDQQYSGDYGPEAIADFTGSLGDYSGDYGPEGIWDFSGSLGDYSGDYGPEGIGGFSGSVGDYGPSGSGDYGPEGVGDNCEYDGTERDTELCGVYGSEDAGPESTYTPTPQWRNPTFLTPAVFFILAVQLSVVVFFFVRGRKEKTFRQGFYVFFVAVTLVETFIVVVRRDVYFGSGYATVFGLPYYVGEYEVTRIVDVIVFIFVSPIIAYAQSFLHLAIVTTRFTAFCFPLGHSSVWSRRNVLALFVGIAALSIPLGVGPPMFYVIRKITANCSNEHVMSDEEEYDYNRDHSWICGFDKEDQDIHWQLLSLDVFNVALSLISAACFVASFFLSMCSVAVLIVLRATRKLQRNHTGPELRLFVHSLVVFLLQTVMVFQTFIYTSDTEEQTEVQRQLFSGFPHSAKWLAGRTGPGEDIAWHECRFVNGCGLFYGLLSGYWVFGYDPNRTIVDHQETAAGNLTPFVFALCGPLSLLAISANVRNGYFRFYTKCLRWRSKRTHVIHVVSSSVVSFSAATPSKTSYRANLRGNRLFL